MKKERPAPLTDEFLQSLLGMKDPETDDFFYTRLKVRMEKQREQPGWLLPVKPAWIIGVLALLLAVNSFIISQQEKKENKVASSLQSFVESYDQTISSSY